MLHTIITSLEPLLNFQCHFKLCGCGYTLKLFFLVVTLTVNELDIKKVQEKTHKTLETYKDGHAKVCKQGRMI